MHYGARFTTYNLGMNEEKYRIGLFENLNTGQNRQTSLSIMELFGISNFHKTHFAEH
jgi:hypothetical protein